MANIGILTHEAKAMGVPRRINARVAEVDHRVANSLSLTAAMLRMQRQRSDDSAVRSALHCAEMRVLSVAKFHGYLHSGGAGERVDLVDFFREVLPEMAEAIGLRCNLAVNVSRTPDVPKRVARQLLIVVNELALNARKHGYGGREGGSISVGLEIGDDDLLRIRIADSGIGLGDDFDPENGDGLGLRIVSSFVRELGGSLSCHTDGGAHFTIAIPLR